MNSVLRVVTRVHACDETYKKEMYKKDRPCDFDGTSARARVSHELILDRGVGDRPNNTILKSSNKDVLISQISFGHLLDIF